MTKAYLYIIGRRVPCQVELLTTRAFHRRDTHVNTWGIMFL